MQNDTDITLKPSELRSEQESFQHIRAVIYKECEEFLKKIFAKEQTLCKPHLDFIKKNALSIPYKNYLQSLELFFTLYKLFSLHDQHFASPTLKKLYRDIETLASRYDFFKTNHTDPKKLFVRLKNAHSELFYYLHAEINRFKKKHSKSKHILNEIAILNQDLKELERYYYEIFYKMHRKSTHMQLENYKTVLNCYIYYAELLMWNEAKKSAKIVQMLLSSGVQGLSSRDFLKYKLSVVLPHTQKYQQYKKIYRNYL